MLNANHRSKSSTASRALAGLTFVALIALAVTMALFSRDNAAVAEATSVQDQKNAVTAPMQFENLADIPIVITEARLSVGEARARTEEGVLPGGRRIQMTYREGQVRDAEFLINLVNQGSRRITEIAVNIQNAPFLGEKDILIISGPKAQAETADSALRAIDPQGNFAFKSNMLLDEKLGDRDLMGHLYDFKIRVVGVKFDSEQEWAWTATEKAKRIGEIRVSLPEKIRDITRLRDVKDEGERKVTTIDPRQQAPAPIIPMDRSTRPTILYKEKAKYTQEARDNAIEGVVILSVVFGADAQIGVIEVVRGLPDGLTEKAIEAAKKIRFEPAVRDGQPVSVRGRLEYSFNLYNDPIQPMDRSTRPTITYREKAQYTQEARDNNVEGTVVLSVVFGVDGQLSGIRVIHGLPHGLSQKAIEAARKIRFEPAMKDGQPVNVRGNLEYHFKLNPDK